MKVDVRTIELVLLGDIEVRIDQSIATASNMGIWPFRIRLEGAQTAVAYEVIRKYRDNGWTVRPRAAGCDVVLEIG